MVATILIADDDAVQRRLVENMVQRCGYIAVTVDSGDAALAHLIDPDTKSVDALVLDLVMPGLDGMGVLAKIRDLGLDLPVIVQTAHSSLETVVTAMRQGAVDFFVKPVAPERLMVSLNNCLKMGALERAVVEERARRDGTLRLGDIVGVSPALRKRPVLPPSPPAAAKRRWPALVPTPVSLP